ncbi:MAG: hypothetical protein J3Q66DRAFT_374682 [Benniella sp.]|nr:MAG: hypothetical protein J3Q66DRAFT_374682 [Benniella sp.]
MTIRFEQLADLASDDLRFIQEGPYDQLNMEQAWETNGYQLADLLRRSPALRYRQFKCHGLHALTSADLAFIRQGSLIQLVIRSTPPPKGEDRLSGILRYCLELGRL